MTRGPLAHVVLHEPEIPNNTGSIGRTCVGMGCSLHLIHPLGFDVDEKACRRAGLDYWPRLDVREHKSFGAYLGSSEPSRVWVFTARGGAPAFDVPFARGDHLVFGKETAGLPDAVLDDYADSRVTVPMVPGERSLNLAVSVGMALVELQRRCVAAGEASLDTDGRLSL